MDVLRGRIPTLFVAGIIVMAVFIGYRLTNPTRESIDTEDYYVIGVSQPNLMEPWRVKMNQQIIEASKEYDALRIIFKDAANSTIKQKEDLDELMGYGVDLLIVSMNDAASLTPYVSDIYESIPVIVLDRDVMGYDYTLFIGLDNYSLGYQAGSFLSKQEGVNHVVEILGIENSKPSIERSIGFSDSFMAIGEKRVDTIAGDWLKDQAQDRFSTLLEIGFDVDGVYAHSDDMAYGAYKAAKEHGKDLLIIGTDGLPGDERGLELVDKGILDATYICPTGGKAAIKYAMDILHHTPGLPKKIILRTHEVTKDNVKGFLDGSISYDIYEPYRDDELPSTIQIGFAQIGSESKWRMANSESIQEAAKEAGIGLDFKNVDNQLSDEEKQERQIEFIREFIDHQVDVIAFSPIVETGWEVVLQEAKEAGIPVILSDRRVKVSPQFYTTYMGSDFVEEGRRAARWLVNHMDKNTTYRMVELEGTKGSAPAKGRQEGFYEIIDNYSNVTLVAKKTADFEYEDGKRCMESILEEENEPIHVVYAHNDDMALGAIEAIEEAGYTAGEDIWVISVDATADALKMIAIGKLNCSVECNPLLGPQMMKAVKELMAGNELPIEIITGESVYTAENVGNDFKKRNY